MDVVKLNKCNRLTQITSDAAELSFIREKRLDGDLVCYIQSLLSGDPLN